jgi:molybdopterin synthase sulfur carrier subunit
MAEVILFGQIAQMAGKDRLTIAGISDTTQLREAINSMYPGLRDIEYAIAIEKKIVREKQAIGEGMMIALLPPFSGG